MAGIHITDIEAAINWWRERSPSPDGVYLPAATRALAEVHRMLSLPIKKKWLMKVFLEILSDCTIREISESAIL